MPTSWSIAAAHRSSRSPGSGSNSPPPHERVVHLQRQPGDVLDVRHVGLVLDGEVADGRLAHVSRTAARDRSSSVRARNTPSRRPASVTSMPSKRAELDHGLERQRGGEDDVAAAGLDPGKRAALVGRQRGELLHELGHHLGRDHEPLDADVDRHRPRAGRRRRGCAPRRRRRRAAARSRPASRAPRASRARGRARAGGPSSWAGRTRRGTRSVSRTAPSGNELSDRGPPVLDLDQLHAAAAELEHDAVGQRRRVDRRDVAVARLVLRGEDLDLEPASPPARGRGTRRGWRRRGSRWWRPRARRIGESPLARQKRANTARVSSPRDIASSLSRPEAPRPAPIRTVSYSSSVRFHHAPGE